MNKLQMLEKMYYEHGDFRICYKNHQYCTKWEKYSEAPDKLKESCNLRELFQDEVVLDYDRYPKLSTIYDKLRALYISFSNWKSPRGFHIHFTFYECRLKSWKPGEIKLLREWFIREFDSDPAKKSGVIALEDAPHFKTGQKKKLIHTEDNGVNCVPTKALKYCKSKASQPIRTTSHGVIKCKLVNVSMYNKLRANTGRGNVLLKNAAVLFHMQRECDTTKSMNQLCSVQGKDSQIGRGWVDWAQSNKVEFSCSELRKWMRETQNGNLEQITCWRCKWRK